MLAQKVQVDDHGRLLLPIKIRKFSGIMPGSSVTVRCNEDGGIKITTVKEGLEKARARWKKYGNGSMDDVVKQMRTEDATKE